jgi:protein-S-isoprenylcysteine O-methyltransferase Ste14
MIKRIAFFAYGTLSYLIFFGTFLYALGFVGNFGVPRTLDGVASGPRWSAFAVDAGLLALFAVQHSVMARRWFKDRWTRVVPGTLERSTYVLFSSLALLLLFWQWRPLGGVVWSVEEPAGRLVLWALFAFGWGLVLVSTFLINHFDLFGLRQVWLYLLGRPYTALTFGAPPALRRLALRLLDDADDDDGAPALLGRHDRLHPRGDPVRGARPRARARRKLRAVPPRRAHARPLRPPPLEAGGVEGGTAGREGLRSISV